MHINYRRTNKFRAKHHNCLGSGYGLAISLTWYKRRAAKDRRAEDRELLAHERYEDFRVRYPRDIYWNYW